MSLDEAKLMIKTQYQFPADRICDLTPVLD